MTAIETQKILPEQLDTKPFDGHEYCVDIYEASRDLPPMFQTREGEAIKTKMLHRKGDRERPVDITRFINRLTEEADVMASLGLEQFKREHPGMGDRQRDEFGEVVRNFSVLSGLLSKKDGSDVTKMSDLSPERFSDVISSLSDLYLPTVRSGERRDAENALKQYALGQIEVENIVEQPERVTETIAA